MDISKVLEQADPETLSQISAAQMWPALMGDVLPAGDTAVQLLLHYELLEPDDQLGYPLATMLEACPSHDGRAHPTAPLRHTEVRALLGLALWEQRWRAFTPTQVPSEETTQRALAGLSAITPLFQTTLGYRVRRGLLRPWERMEQVLVDAPTWPFRKPVARCLADLHVQGQFGIDRLSVTLALLAALEPDRRWALAMAPQALSTALHHPATPPSVLQAILGTLGKEVSAALALGSHHVDEPGVAERFPEEAARHRAQLRAQALEERPRAAPSPRSRPRA